MNRLYIICGCNGAGKTTASLSVLPNVLSCRQFVNADEIAKGLSPLSPDSVAIEAGKLMLDRIDSLMQSNIDFAVETTLASRLYVRLIKRAKESGYRVSLLYFWLPSPEMAAMRVAMRVSQGGHDIPRDVITRRYWRGLCNLFDLYIPIVDEWSLFDNSKGILPIVVNNEVVDIEKLNHLKKLCATMIKPKR